MAIFPRELRARAPSTLFGSPPCSGVGRWEQMMTHWRSSSNELAQKALPSLPMAFVPRELQARAPSTLGGSLPCSSVGRREQVEPAMGNLPSPTRACPPPKFKRERAPATLLLLELAATAGARWLYPCLLLALLMALPTAQRWSGHKSSSNRPGPSNPQE
jgi:hypothetical protein